MDERIHTGQSQGVNGEGQWELCMDWNVRLLWTARAHYILQPLLEYGHHPVQRKTAYRIHEGKDRVLREECDWWELPLGSVTGLKLKNHLSHFGNFQRVCIRCLRTKLVFQAPSALFARNVTDLQSAPTEYAMKQTHYLMTMKARRGSGKKFT